MELISNNLTCKAAISLGVFSSYGKICLQKACSDEVLDEPFSEPQRLHFGGRSSVLGNDSFDEEICWRGNRVVWSAGRIVRRRFTLESPVLQVAWATFSGNEAGSTLCMLQNSALTTYTLSGQLQTVPVPAAVTSLHPILQGLLLSGTEGAGCSLLTHPLEEVQALTSEFSTDISATWQGEHIIWSSSELPYIAAYSKRLGRAALWHIKQGDPAPQIPAGLQPRTPAQLLRAPNGIPQSASKRHGA
ncbi:probable anaphase-promoting complex subunit 1 at N-terminal half [Coccomyxa sp. Obi]|nr:probable anaphase-promoting complex subunit 1 at N-terminal half [Coccomyxa sp. Obi]